MIYLMNNRIEKIERLIKEGHVGIQDLLIDAMMSLKKNNPELKHNEIIDLFQKEVDKFLQFHKKDRLELPSQDRVRVLKDKMPYMKIPYGKKRKGGF